MMTCSICTEDYSSKELFVNKFVPYIIEHPGHSYHTKCLKQWGAEHNNCPVNCGRLIRPELELANRTFRDPLRSLRERISAKIAAYSPATQILLFGTPVLLLQAIAKAAGISREPNSPLSWLLHSQVLPELALEYIAPTPAAAAGIHAASNLAAFTSNTLQNLATISSQANTIYKQIHSLIDDHFVKTDALYKESPLSNVIQNFRANGSVGDLNSLMDSHFEKIRLQTTGMQEELKRQIQSLRAKEYQLGDKAVKLLYPCLFLSVWAAYKTFSSTVSYALDAIKQNPEPRDRLQRLKRYGSVAAAISGLAAVSTMINKANPRITAFFALPGLVALGAALLSEIKNSPAP